MMYAQIDCVGKHWNGHLITAIIDSKNLKLLNSFLKSNTFIMKQKIRKFIFLFTVIVSLFFSCKKRPYIPDYTNTGGFVIGRETCKTNEIEDYWLVDLSFYPNTPPYGDTLILSGITYTNVVKVKTLDQRLKQIGMKVSLDFKTVTPNKIITSGCNVSNPVTYVLKVLFIINQFEIR